MSQGGVLESFLQSLSSPVDCDSRTALLATGAHRSASESGELSAIFAGFEAPEHIQAEVSDAHRGPSGKAICELLFHAPRETQCLSSYT